MSQLLLWDTEVVRRADGVAELRARKPLSTCSIERVLAILGLEDTRGGRWTVYHLVRTGRLRATKPGAVAKREDGKRSNARLVFDMESVLRYKQGLETEDF